MKWSELFGIDPDYPPTDVDQLESERDAAREELQSLRVAVARLIGNANWDQRREHYAVPLSEIQRVLADSMRGKE